MSVWKSKLRILLIVLAIVAAAFLIMLIEPFVKFGADAPVEDIEVGELAHNFTMENLDGEVVSLEDFRGSLVLLGFASEADTAIDLFKYRKKLKPFLIENKVVMLQVAQVNKPAFITRSFIISKIKSEPEKLKEMPEDSKYIFIDWGGELGLNAQYGIEDLTTPDLFLISREGEILFSFDGFFTEDHAGEIQGEISKILAGDEVGKRVRNTGDMIRIGASSIMAHPALELAFVGFKDALKEGGYVEGDNISIDFQNAGGDFEKMTRIPENFIEDQVDAIFSLSIIGTQKMVEAVKDIPIVYAMVMNPIDVCVVPSMGPCGMNVTGMGTYLCPLQDRWPVEEQLEIYVKCVPGAKKWGTVYAESVNTLYHIKKIREESKRLGLELVEATVPKTAKPEEIRQAARSMVGKVETMYIASDPVAMSAFEAIAEICNQNDLPLFGGELECVSRGAVAAYNGDYYLNGYRGGEKMVRILRGEHPGDIPSEYTKKLYLHINLKNADEQGITIPEEFKQIADNIM